MSTAQKPIRRTTVALVENSVCEWRPHCVWRQGSACAGDREGAVQPRPGLETNKLSLNGPASSSGHSFAVHVFCKKAASLTTARRATTSASPRRTTSIFPCTRHRPHLATQSASSCQPRTSVPTQRRHDVAVARELAEGQPRWTPGVVRFTCFVTLAVSYSAPESISTYIMRRRATPLLFGASKLRRLPKYCYQSLQSFRNGSRSASPHNRSCKLRLHDRTISQHT
jgi:hypothetical protein